MLNIDSISHVKGESLYIDDLPIVEGTLFGYVVSSPVANGVITKLDLSKALALDGVVQIFTSKDIPGENQIGLIIQDEQLFAEKEVHFIGQPIAFIVAENECIAKKAATVVNVEITELPAVTDAREAQKKGLLIFPPRTFKLGDIDVAFEECDHVFEGTVESGGQEHLYLETQGAYSIPAENGNIKIASATQGPTAVQKITARVLGIPMHKIEVEVLRLGGGFGGKEDQATPWAVMTALAAFYLKKPVKYCMDRGDDLRMTGKRHPYSSDYKIGLDKDLKIKAYQVNYYQNAGAAADLSPAIVERTLFHGTNAYYIPNVSLTAWSCKTNLPPNTAFRGFGAPQGVFVIESAIAEAANQLNIYPETIQKANLLHKGCEFSYGQIATQVLAEKSWKQADEKFGFENKRKEIDAFNKANKYTKKGLTIMPICFGISFTNTVMNHARALVHIYQDGSIGVSTGAVEMGQSVNTKMVQVATSVFGVKPERIKLETTNTTRVANTSPSAASSTADLNGKALQIACNSLLDRVLQKASELLAKPLEKLSLQKESVFYEDKETELEWEQLIEKAFLDRINLSAVGHYSTPKVQFDKSKEKGHPFAYHVYGTAMIVARVDCIRGEAKIEEVKLVHDFGKSINLIIDKGQVEGGVVQSIGWVTMEEIVHSEKGQLLSNALSSYKVPDIYSVPAIFETEVLDTKGHEFAILKSKAVGEPPFIYGIGGYFAIQQAVNAYNPEYIYKFNLPFTNEKVLMALYSR
jgi:xanthine dehydrogenase large subunit